MSSCEVFFDDAAEFTSCYGLLICSHSLELLCHGASTLGSLHQLPVSYEAMPQQIQVFPSDLRLINRNTIQWIYSQLKEEGLLTIQKGLGTQVADKDKIEAFKRQNPHFSFVEQTIKQVYEMGYDAENVLLSGFAYVQLFGQPLEKKLRYLFIECKTQSCVFYLDEIKQMAAPNVHTIDMSSPEDIFKEAIRNADVIVTRADLAKNVKMLTDIEQKTVISVGSTNDVSLLLNMLRP
ncbi:hypothetical protein [Paenibacillus tyrfis]|uniref:hypothetical protein n=1 Tax=Paenibacillus tyrfis TaxID=1501230 RepID=UPI0011811E4A|nr:hypothetical protein [Paenibacillus tyrfis]